MAKGRRAARARAGENAHDGARSAEKPATPFAGLRAQIRGTKQTASEPLAPAKRIRHAPPQAAAETTEQAADDGELELFRKAAGKVQPVRGGDRAEIERPRPAPVPHHASVHDEAIEQAHSARAETDPLRLAYQGVMPLRDRGRIELDTPLRHTIRHPGSEQTARIQRPDAIVLPADADLRDPAALFRSVVGDARPVGDRNRVELERVPPLPAPIKREEDERAALHESLAAPLTFEDRLDMGDEAAFLRPGLPRRVLTDLRRGRWVLQGQIDLHGLTRDEARSALAHFLHDALAQGKRCIRVIHGKGHGSPGKVSILKQLSRGWLAQREEILCFCQAGPNDGGGGALLVLLRAQNAAQR
ncbi:Smr/MutS family protein [Thauera sp.]|jgi:DNA-nicking Smr family endonuclease|uniref:Smr/MutS family protein n=1 Tax=Thauera sp. TaxID=1905334 RepID=UPI002A37141C|nr:Smr/MutS family protein [Thauera sp.]MDX9884850.1 Smr/MutS family protein [Thauera sp.]